MVQFHTERIHAGIIRIHGVGGEKMYLVEGEKRAALIDTGCGAGDLRSVVESLTKKPVIVLISHAHMDHAMGIPQFRNVYMSTADMDIYRRHCALEMRKAYLSGSPAFLGITEDEYIPQAQYSESENRIQNLQDGDCFDLGGLTVEAVACAGHTPGSMMFLLREPRILFSGDACNYFTMLQGDECLGLCTYERSLQNAKVKTDGKYDAILLSHGDTMAPITLLGEVLEVCGQVKAGTDDKIPFEFMGALGYVAKAFINNGINGYARRDGKAGNIVYHKDRVWE